MSVHSNSQNSLNPFCMKWSDSIEVCEQRSQRDRISCPFSRIHDFAPIACFQAERHEYLAAVALTKKNSVSRKHT